jgi:hypothetical protein
VPGPRISLRPISGFLALPAGGAPPPPNPNHLAFNAFITFIALITFITFITFLPMEIIIEHCAHEQCARAHRFKYLLPEGFFIYSWARCNKRRGCLYLRSNQWSRRARRAGLASLCAWDSFLFTPPPLFFFCIAPRGSAILLTFALFPATIALPSIFMAIEERDSGPCPPYLTTFVIVLAI